MTVLLRLLGLGAVVLVVAFAIANRGSVTVSFSPLPFSLSVPIYLLVLVGMVIGAIAGGIGGWRRAAPVRRLVQERKREIAKLQDEIAAVHARRREPAPSGDGVPAKRIPLASSD